MENSIMLADVMLPTPFSIGLAILVFLGAFAIPLIVTIIVFKFSKDKLKNKKLLSVISVLAFIVTFIIYTVTMEKLLRNPEYEKVIKEQKSASYQ